MLYRALERALEAHGVPRAGDHRVLVACSGGADSVALAHVTRKLLGSARVTLGHVDHAVRPGSADDAQAVLAFARGLSCRAASSRLDPGPDDEARLRHLRYAALERLRRHVGADLILTAHTEDDQAETVLLGLIRSAHPNSLFGMPEQRGPVVRPWLSVARSEVHQHVARHGLPVRADPSNREPKYVRNRLRKELLPLLESRYRPGVGRRLAALARTLRERADPDGDLAPPDPAADLRRLADALGRARAAWDRARSPLDPEAGPLGPVRIDHASGFAAPWPDGRAAAVFDAAEAGGLRLRRWREGDVVIPFGRKGPRRVTEVLRSAGIPSGLRRLCSVLVDEHDRILWVPGVLRSDFARVGPTTPAVWICRVDRKDELRGGATRATLDGDVSGAHKPDD